MSALRTVFVIFLLTLAFTQLVLNIGYVEQIAVEIDAIASLIRVIDGDTIEVLLLNVNAKFKDKVFVNQRVHVRLADINAPELYVDSVRNEPGWRSREALINLLKGVNTIYLDIDDTEVYDWYDRLIAVVYVDYNTTHFLNVNKWLVDNGYARVWDFRNSTDPKTWVLYIDKTRTISGELIDNKERGKTLFKDKTYLELTIIYAAIGVATTIAFIYAWRTTGVKK